MGRAAQPKKDSRKVGKVTKKAISKPSKTSGKSQKIAPVKCPTFTLNNGTKIPVLGLGTFLHDDCKQQVKDAILKYGYRHIDTAKIYGNEAAIGEAL